MIKLITRSLTIAFIVGTSAVTPPAIARTYNEHCFDVTPLKLCNLWVSRQSDVRSSLIK